MSRFLEKIKLHKYTILDIVVIEISLLIMNRRSWLCIYEINKPLFFCEYGTWIDETIFLTCLVGIGILTLIQSKQFKQFLNLWKVNWLLVLFLLFGILSFAWSISTIGTLQRVLQLTLSTILAAYLGFRFSNRQVLQGLFIFTIFMTFVSYLLVAILPGAGIMTTYPHEGSWRGVFSHRNYLGSIAAFGSVVALITFVAEKGVWKKQLLAAFVFIGIFVLILKSNSATGLILMVLLNLVFLALLGWGFLWPKMRIWMRVGVISTGAVLIFLIILNLEKILNLIGRNTTLTGRIPLWQYLFNKVAEHNLWLGYGLGTIWTFESFRVKSAVVLGWPFQIINGHNGFIDVLLYLGIIGFILLTVLLAYILIVTVKHFLKYRTTLSILPLITIVYVLIANITISFFFEFETFHWCLLILFLFLITSQNAGDKNLRLTTYGSVPTESFIEKKS